MFWIFVFAVPHWGISWTCTNTPFLRPRFLSFYIPLDRCWRYVVCGRNKVASCPKARHRWQYRKLLAKFNGRKPFDPLYDIRNAILRRHIHEYMNMIDMTLHSKNLYASRFAPIGSKFLKAFFHPRYIKNLPAIAWTKDNMVVDERYSCFGS